MDKADVAIIGGGPAGTAAAIAMARAGSTVVLLERTHYDRIRVGEIMPPVARLPLCALGVWDRFRAERWAPSPGIVSAWGQPELHANDFVFDPYGNGWHIDRSRFDQMLAMSAEEAGVRIQRGARLVACQDEFRHWQLDAMMGGETLRLHTDFLIDATGRASSLARRLGGGRIVYDRLVGVVGLLDSPDVEALSDRRALVESCPGGWWYSAPLPGQRLVAAYMTDADQVAGAKMRPIHLWWQHLRSAPFTEKRIGSSRVNVDLRIVAASTSKRQRLAGNNWIAVGDAAVALDPLSGQGIIRALESGLAAARALTSVGAGRREALNDYVADIERRFLCYLQLRAEYYGRETRWHDSTFWARRSLNHQPSPTGKL